jgi:hypothetical protein
MAYDNQVDYDEGITYFNISVLYVNAENPSADNDIPAPFD